MKTKKNDFLFYTDWDDRVTGSASALAGKLAAFARRLQPGEMVTHVTYGAGMVVSQDGKRVQIRFADKDRVMNIKTLYQKNLLQ